MAHCCEVFRVLPQQPVGSGQKEGGRGGLAVQGEHPRAQHGHSRARLLSLAVELHTRKGTVRKQEKGMDDVNTRVV